MPVGVKNKPSKLAEKLLAVRLYLDLSQEEMGAVIQPNRTDTSKPLRPRIHEYEKGKRVPSLLEIFYYAKAVRDKKRYKKFNSDNLIDDDRPLPWLDSEN